VQTTSQSQKTLFQQEERTAHVQTVEHLGLPSWPDSGAPWLTILARQWSTLAYHLGRTVEHLGSPSWPDSGAPWLTILAGQWSTLAYHLGQTVEHLDLPSWPDSGAPWLTILARQWSTLAYSSWPDRAPSEGQRWRDSSSSSSAHRREPSGGATERHIPGAMRRGRQRELATGAAAAGRGASCVLWKRIRRYKKGLLPRGVSQSLGSWIQCRGRGAVCSPRLRLLAAMGQSTSSFSRSTGGSPALGPWGAGAVTHGAQTPCSLSLFPLSLSLLSLVLDHAGREWGRARMGQGADRARAWMRQGWDEARVG